MSIVKGMIISMDTREKVSSNRNYKFNIDKFNSQTWEDFDYFRKKKVFIFGIGYGAEFYFENDENHIVGIIDNDKKKQGLPIDLFVNKKALNKCQEKKVLDVSVLNQYPVDHIVILIANLNASEQIAEQLESLGINNYFSLIAMETIRTKSFIRAKDYIIDNIYKKQTDKIEPNKLVFYNTGGYFGHGKYITEQLLKLRNDLDIVWIVSDLTLNVPEGIRLVYGGNRNKYIPELETAKMWIYDNLVPLYFQKRPEQIYVQVKHWSSVTLKTFGFDVSNFRNEDRDLVVYKHNSVMIDYIITGSEFDTDACRSGFVYNGKVLQAGSPRSDILFNEGQYREKICNYFNLDNNKKILLYAPTFRYKQGVYYTPEAYETNIDYGLLVKKLADRFTDDWSILLRLHPIVSDASTSMKRPDYVIDASDYPDSQELVAAADVMITDYSSIMFEPAFVRKPVFLYAPDRKEYIDGERKLLIDYDTLPFPIAESNEELAYNIESFKQDKYVSKVDEFMEKYGVHEDGHASERVARFILDLIDGIRSN